MLLITLGLQASTTHRVASAFIVASHYSVQARQKASVYDSQAFINEQHSWVSHTASSTSCKSKVASPALAAANPTQRLLQVVTKEQSAHGCKGHKVPSEGVLPLTFPALHITRSGSQLCYHHLKNWRVKARRRLLDRQTQFCLQLSASAVAICTLPV